MLPFSFTTYIWCIALQCITVGGGLDVRQDSIWDYRDTVTGPRADTTNVCVYCIDIAQAGKYTAHPNDTVTGPRADTTNVYICIV